MAEDNQFTTCGQPGDASKWWKGSLIVDSNGVGWTVAGTKNPRSKGRFGGFSLMYQRAIQVDLVFEDATRLVSLSESNRLLSEYVRKERYFFNEEWDLKKLYQRINESQTHREMMGVFMQEHGEF